MNYPYRECHCGKQIHVGGRSLCDDCINGGPPPEPKTLRDEIAIAAMQGMLASGANWSDMYQCDNGKIAGDVVIAYRIADGMLKAREE